MTAAVPSWEDRAAYMAVVGRVQRALGRELDLAQPGQEPSITLLERLHELREAHAAYYRACRLAAIGLGEGTMEP